MAGSILERAMARVDTWLNAVTGVGVSSGRNAYEYVASPRLTDQSLEDLYRDPYAGRVCRILPAEALRQGFRVGAGKDTTVETAFATRLRKLKASEALYIAWTWSRVFGGGAVLINADDGLDPSKPLDLASIKRVHSLVPLNRRELLPLQWHRDPLDPDYGSVETYTLARMGGQSADTRSVHASRLLRFRGQLVTHQEEIRLQGWGESELQRIYPVLQQFNGAFAATSTLLNDASQGVFSIKDFLDMMAGGKRDLLMQRLALMDSTRSSGRSIMVDADTEKYEKVETGALSGLPDVLKLYLLLLAGATGIPVTLLMGQAPAGLQATGEMDVRNWYDLVKTEQTQTLQPHLERLVEILTHSQDGPTQGRPVHTTIEFAPLWQPTPKERADERLVVAQSDQIYVTIGAVLPEEVAASRFRADGWNAETKIDLDARDAALEADRAAGRLPSLQGGGAGPGEQEMQDASSEAAGGVDQANGVMGIVARVAAREIPRDAGIGLLCQTFGLSPERAEAVMGAAGKTFFTKPDPAAADELVALRAAHAKLQASARGTKQVLNRVLERNRAGELVVGSPIGRAATELTEGEVLEEGDVVEVPVEDSARSLRTDGRGEGVAVVLELPREAAEGLPTEMPAEDLHVTLAYLGLREGFPAERLAKLRDLVERFAATAQPVAATMGGVDSFPAGPDGVPVYVPVESLHLVLLRMGLVTRLGPSGFPQRSTHPFVPHVTLAYVEPGTPLPEPVPTREVTFARVAVWAGGERWGFELKGSA